MLAGEANVAVAAALSVQFGDVSGVGLVEDALQLDSLCVAGHIHPGHSDENQAAPSVRHLEKAAVEGCAGIAAKPALDLAVGVRRTVVVAQLDPCPDAEAYSLQPAHDGP